MLTKFVLLTLVSVALLLAMGVLAVVMVVVVKMGIQASVWID